MPLEEALKQFERGIELTRSCQASLKQAEQRVEILLRKTPEAEPEPFETKNSRRTEAHPDECRPGRPARPLAPTCRARTRRLAAA